MTVAFKDVIAKEPKRAYMLANEAIVRAALESDVKVYSAYPGSPTTEILDTFDSVGEELKDIRMEIAVNEKVALEVAAGAAMVGLRSFTSMKSVGVNVAADALYVMAYTGVRAGCVLLLADDPHCHSSQSEQDGRWYGYTAYLPMFDPSSPQEAFDMTKAAFELSEKHRTISLLRTTTRINHQSGIVLTGELKRTPFKKHDWDKNRTKYSAVGQLARERKLELLRKVESMRADSEASSFNREEYFDGKRLHRGPMPKEETCRFGIVASGISYCHTLEALRRLEAKARIFKVGLINPLPVSRLSSFIRDLDRLMVVEELSPYLEGFLRGAAKDGNPSLRMLGKGFGPFTEYSEYNIPMMVEAVTKALDVPAPFDYWAHKKRMDELASILPQRIPIFCAGCPHRGTFTALRRAIGKTPVYFANDIGCYTMLVLPPMEWSDSQLCMGASLGIAAGVDFAANEKVVVAMGDSTLFHAGLPGIVNAIHNGHNMTMVILDNSVTAMTGQQTHPGQEGTMGGGKGKALDIETVLRGLGVEKIVKVDSFQIRKNIKLMKEALDHKGFSVILSKGECALYHFRNLRRAGHRPVPFFVDKEKCNRPYNCIKDFLCPAISIDEADGKSRISPELCVGCGECAQMCGFGAIRSTAVRFGAEDRPYYTVEDHESLKRFREGSKKGVKE